MKNAIIFDLDGTLWDSCEQIALSWSQALAPYGVSLSVPDVQKFMGKTVQEISAMLLPDHSPEERASALAACTQAEDEYIRRHGAILYPGIKRILPELATRYELCIISNCQVGYIELFLEYTGLSGCITDTECAGRTGRSKGENIALVLERNRFDRAIYVGDTQRDFESAQYAGIPFIHAAYGFGTVNTPVPAIQSFEELPERLNSFFPE